MSFLDSKTTFQMQLNEQNISNKLHCNCKSESYSKRRSCITISINSFFFLASLLFLCSFLFGNLMADFANRKINFITDGSDKEVNLWKKGNYSFPKSENDEFRLDTIQRLMVDFNHVDKEILQN